MTYSCVLDEVLMKTNPLGHDWKLVWREREKNPLTRKQVRQEKRETRRRIHRDSRRRVREALRHILD